MELKPGKLYRATRNNVFFYFFPVSSEDFEDGKYFHEGDVFLYIDTRRVHENARLMHRFLDKNGKLVETYTALWEGILEEVRTK